MTEQQKLATTQPISSALACALLKDLWATFLSGSSALLNPLSSLIPPATTEYPDNPSPTDRFLYALFFLANSLSAPPPTDLAEALHACKEQERLLALIAERSKSAAEVQSNFISAKQIKLDADNALADQLAVRAALEKKFQVTNASVQSIFQKADQKVELARAAQLAAAERLSEALEAQDEVASKKEWQIVKKIENLKLQAIASFSRRFLRSFIDLGSACHDAAPFNRVNGDAVVGCLDALTHLEGSERTLEVLQKCFIGLSAPTTTTTELKRVEDAILAKQKDFDALASGQGDAVEKILEANGVKVRGVKETEKTNIVQIVGFSQPLPLKDAAKIWSTLAVEERHTELEKVTCFPEFEHPGTPRDSELHASSLMVDSQTGRPPPSLTGTNAPNLNTPAVSYGPRETAHWDLISYEHLLLSQFCATDSMERIGKEEKNKLRTALQLARVKLRVPTRQHQLFSDWLFPPTDRHTTAISPLDVRFRLLRLLSISAPSDFAATPLFKAFIDRQLTIVKFCVDCWVKEDSVGAHAGVAHAGTHISQSALLGDMILLVENALVSSQYPPAPATLWPLIDACTEFCGGRQLSYPVGFFACALPRIWRCVADSNSDTGVHADAEPLIALVHNVTTARQFPHHGLLLASALWDKNCLHSSIVHTATVRTMRDILCGVDSLVGASVLEDSWVAEKAGMWFTSPNYLPIKSNYLLDLAYLRLVTASCRSSIFEALCDYRKRLDTDSLTDLIAIWRSTLQQHLNRDLPAMQRPTAAELDAHVGGLLVHFIVESAKTASSRFVDTLRFTDPVMISRAHANDEARAEWIEAVTDSLWRCVFEFSCERDLYAATWESLGLGRVHLQTWAAALQGKIRSVIEMIANDDELWPVDRVPPGGTDLMQVCEIWERTSKDSGLTETLKPKLTQSLAVRLDKIEKESVPRCLHANPTLGPDNGLKDAAWIPLKPPTVLHSSKCVDLWSTLFTAISACLESAPVALALNTCLQMIARSVTAYTSNVLDGIPTDTRVPFPLAIKAQRALNRLLKSQKDEREVPELYKEKNRAKNKLFRTRASARQYYDGEVVVNEDEDTTNFNTGMSVNIITDNHMFYSEYCNGLATNDGHSSNALMVRLQDLVFCQDELEKSKEMLIAEVEKEHGKLQSLIKNQSKHGNVLRLPEPDKSILQTYTNGINKIVANSKGSVGEAIPRVTSLLVHRLVYVELREDIFENLYVPTCAEQPFSRLVRKFQVDGWPAFLSLAPLNLKKAMHTQFFETLLSAWVYVVADMAARGRPFSTADVNVLLSDSEALHSLADSLGCKADVQELLRIAGTLPLLISGGSFDFTAEEALREPNDTPARAKKPKKKEQKIKV